VDDLIERYKAGSTVHQLAKAFGVHRTTVGVVLRRNGVDTSRQVLDDSHLPEIERLRALGWSYERVGARFGVTGGAVWLFMRKRRS
jgi:transcriptional regulator with XRE-family HTH domain